MELRSWHASQKKNDYHRELHARGANCTYWVNGFLIFIVIINIFMNIDTMTQQFYLNQTSFTVIICIHSHGLEGKMVLIE